MNVWAITYVFGDEQRVMLKEFPSDWDINDVTHAIHPAIRTKNPTVEFVGELA